MLRECCSDLIASHPSVAVELHKGVGRPAEAARINDRAVSANNAACLQAVDPSLHRRGGEADQTADIVKRTARILPEQSQDLLIRIIELAHSARTAYRAFCARLGLNSLQLQHN